MAHCCIAERPGGLLRRLGQPSCGMQVHDAQEQHAEVADIIDGRHALGSHLLLSYNAQASQAQMRLP